MQFTFQLNHLINRGAAVRFFSINAMYGDHTFGKSINTNRGLFESPIFVRLSLLTWAEYRVVATSQLASGGCINQPNKRKVNNQPKKTKEKSKQPNKQKKSQNNQENKRKVNN